MTDRTSGRSDIVVVGGGNGAQASVPIGEITVESLRHMRRSSRHIRAIGGSCDCGSAGTSSPNSNDSCRGALASPLRPSRHRTSRRSNTTSVASTSSFRLAGIDIARSRVGCIDLTPDLIPIIGAIGQRKQLFVAAGFSGHGFALGPVIGKLMAELIADGRTSLDLSRFRVSPFAERDDALPCGAL